MRFINLPLRFIEKHPRYLTLFLLQGINPELGIDSLAMDTLPRAWHENTARIFHSAGLTCAVHLPFFDLHPGSTDRLILQATRKRLLHAVDIAKIYCPAHFVAHLAYDNLVYANFYETWLKNSVATWNLLLEHLQSTPLYLENVHEDQPAHLVTVLAGLNNRAKVCFDLGHWHSFAQGCERKNLHEWLDVLDDRIGHLHLHDNDGSGDQHLGLGLGCIHWEQLWEFLRKIKAPVGATFEPHTEADFLATESYLAAHPTIDF